MSPAATPGVRASSVPPDARGPAVNPRGLERPSAPTDTRRRNTAAWAVLAVLGAVLMIPTLSIAHVEGFSTVIISLGMHIRDGNVRAFDYLYGANLDYFGLSRLGAALAMGLLTSIPGMSGELAFRLVMWVGTAALAASTWVLVRRWTGAPHLLIAAALLLLPTITESAFVYNDNLPSAALAVGALAVLVTTRGLAPAALAGLLFGLGMVTRADAVLLGPAVLLLLYEQSGVSRASVWRGLAFGLGLLLPVVGLYHAFGATYLDVIKISQYTVYLWNRGLGKVRQAEQILLFFSVPGLILAAAGVLALARRREYLRLLLLAGVPALYNVITFGKLWQARQLLPLTPMFVSLTVLGWQVLPSLVGRRRPAAWPRWAIAALTTVVLFAPPSLVVLEDGPRVLLAGRVGNLREWLRWQRGQNANQRYLRALASELGARGPAVVITDEFTADEYMHFALQEAGFSATPAGSAYPACRRTAELWRNGDRVVVHVRLHFPFVTSYVPLIPQRFAADGMPCIAAVRPASTYYVEARGWAGRMLGRNAPVPVWEPGRRVTQMSLMPPDSAAHAKAPWVFDKPFVAVPLDPVTFSRMRAGFSLDSAKWQRAAIAREAHFYTEMKDADRALRSQVHFAR